MRPPLQWVGVKAEYFGTGDYLRYPVSPFQAARPVL